VSKPSIRRSRQESCPRELSQWEVKGPGRRAGARGLERGRPHILSLSRCGARCHLGNSIETWNDQHCEQIARGGRCEDQLGSSRNGETREDPGLGSYVSPVSQTCEGFGSRMNGRTLWNVCKGWSAFPPPRLTANKGRITDRTYRTSGLDRGVQYRKSSVRNQTSTGGRRSWSEDLS
jgi:hypothetical protein